MTAPLVITVTGVPAPQGSKSVVKRGDHVQLLEGSSTVGRMAHAAWRAAVTAAAFPHRRRLDPTVALVIDVAFVMPKPKSRNVSDHGRPHAVKPDLDKLLRSTLDGLADGQAIGEDSRVAQIHATKRYADKGEATGARIIVAEVDA